MTHTGALDAFVARESELKQTLNFGQWLKHIAASHDQLLELVRTSPRCDRRLRLFVTLAGPDGRPERLTYEVPGESWDVAVTEDGRVWATLDDGRTVAGTLVSRHPGPILAPQPTGERQ